MLDTRGPMLDTGYNRIFTSSIQQPVVTGIKNQ